MIVNATRRLLPLSILVALGLASAGCAAESQDDVGQGDQAETVDGTATAVRAFQKYFATATIRFDQEISLVNRQEVIAVGWAHDPIDGSKIVWGQCTLFMTDKSSSLLPKIPAGDVYSFDPKVSIFPTNDGVDGFGWKIPLRNKKVAVGRANDLADFYMTCTTQGREYRPGPLEPASVENALRLPTVAMTFTL